MNKPQLYEAIKQRMKNFNLSFDEAREEIKKMNPQYTDILNELIAPQKIRVDINEELWEEITNLMYMASGNSYESSEENIQRKLGLVTYLFNKEFKLWN